VRGDAVVVATLLLSTLAYYAIERPFMRLRTRPLEQQRGARLRIEATQRPSALLTLPFCGRRERGRAPPEVPELRTGCRTLSAGFGRVFRAPSV
jgi:hypothetical protein